MLVLFKLKYYLMKKQQQCRLKVDDTLVFGGGRISKAHI